MKLIEVKKIKNNQKIKNFKSAFKTFLGPLSECVEKTFH